MKWKMVALFALIAGTSSQALAQGVAPPQPTAAQPDGAAAARAGREQQEGFNRVVNQGVKITNGEQDDAGAQQRTRRKAPVMATAADISAGAALRDRNGLQIGTIERLEADGAVVKAGDKLAKLPLDAFGKDDSGLLIAITAEEFQAAIAQTAVPVAPEEPEVVAATAEDMTPGAGVRDSDGVQFGTVEQLVESGVIVLTDGKKVKLAVDSFGKDQNGLMIGITVSELRALMGNSASASTGS